MIRSNHMTSPYQERRGPAEGVTNGAAVSTITRLMRQIVLAVAMAVLAEPVPAAFSQPADASTLIPLAREVVDRLVSGQVEPLFQMFNEKMKAAIDADGLRRMIPSRIAQLGPFKSQVGARTESQDVLRVVFITCAFERANVDVRVAFDTFDRVVGIGFRPPVSTVAYAPPAYVTPSAFRDESLTVDAGGWPLPGTLSLPVGEGPFPGVVLVHGSGPNDRDESIGPNRPFRDLAEGLASRGIAVLRYDKRTRVHAGRIAGLGDFTVKDEVVDDAIAAVAAMRRSRAIRSDRVFVLGHSLGGMLAPRIAAGDPAIAGLVVMAGPSKSLDQPSPIKRATWRCSMARYRLRNRKCSMPPPGSLRTSRPSSRRIRRSWRRASAPRRRIGSISAATIRRQPPSASGNPCWCCRASATTR